MSRRRAGLLAVMLTSSGGAAWAQDEPPEPPAGTLASELENTRWSMIQPDGDFEAGCATGYMSVQLRANNYFIFNNRVAGAWTLDNTGKLRLRARQGPYIMLAIEGDKLQLLHDLPALRVRKRTLFQRCSE